MDEMLKEEKYKKSCEEFLTQLIGFIPDYLSSKNFSTEYQEQCSRLAKILEKAIEFHIIPTIGHIERLKQLVIQARKEEIKTEIEEFYKLIHKSSTPEIIKN